MGLDSVGPSNLKFRSDALPPPQAGVNAGESAVAHTIQKVSTEIFKNGQSNPQEAGPIQHHEIHELDLDDLDDEDLRELQRLEEEEQLLTSHLEQAETEQAKNVEVEAEELAAAQGKQTLEDAETQKESHEFAREESSLSEVREVQPEAAKLKALLDQTYVLSPDGKKVENLAHLATTSPKNAKNSLVSQNLFRYDPATGKIHIPEHLVNLFKAGDKINLPDAQGGMRECQVENIVIMSDEEFATFKANIKLAVQDLLNALILQNPPEKKKIEKKKESDAEVEAPKEPKAERREARQEKQQERINVSQEVPDVSISPSERRKKEIEKLEKALTMKYQERIQFNEKEDLKELTLKSERDRGTDIKGEADYFVDKNETQHKLMEAAKIEKEVVEKEILAPCKELQMQDHISPEEKEKYRRLELKIKEMSSALTKKVGSADTPTTEKVKALKEFFELVSIALVEINGRSTPFTKIPKTG